VLETLEASAELACAALLYLDSEESKVNVELEEFRKDYYGRINKPMRDDIAGNE